MDTTLDWVTLGVAAYAALVATSVSIWAGIGVRRDRTAIKVEVRFGYVSSSARGSWVTMPPNYEPARVDDGTRLVVQAIIVGRRSVTLNAGGLVNRNGNLDMFNGDGFDKTYPIRPDEGQSGSTWSFLSNFRDTSNPPNRAFFRSEVGKIYTTKLSKDVLRALREQSSETP